MRPALSLLLAFVLVGILVELSCLAGERFHAQPSAAPAALFIAAPTLDPPSVSEVDADEIPVIAASPALTR
jgi:hypothetical protein